MDIDKEMAHTEGLFAPTTTDHSDIGALITNDLRIFESIVNRRYKLFRSLWDKACFKPSILEHRDISR